MERSERRSSHEGRQGIGHMLGSQVPLGETCGDFGGS